MDDKEYSSSNENPVSIGRNEQKEYNEVNMNGDESSANNCNAWVHLKTITTFDSDLSCHKGRNNTYQSLNESCSKSSCNLTKNVYQGGVGEEKHHPQKRDIGLLNKADLKVHKRNHTKQLDGLSTESYVKMSTADQSFFISDKAEISKTNLHMKHGQKRRGSLSEGNSPNTSIVDAVGNVTASSLHRNGTVSDIGGDYGSIRSHAPAPVQSLTRFSPTSLLVESLIDQLCKLMEKDSGKQKKLYHVICERLHQMQLIDDTYTIEEFQFMRSHYQRALYQLLTVAKSSTQSSGGRNILLPLPSSNVDVDIKLNSEKVLEWSRYRHEYQELEYIAKGGFGHVYKVRNKLDGGQYAIKKIFLRYRYVEGFLRSLKEVKMLARLNHPNIVSYKAAWLEPLDDDAQKARLRKSSHSSVSQGASISIVSINSTSRLPLPPAPSVTAEDSIDIVFQDTSPDTDSRSGASKSPKHNQNSAFTNEGNSNVRTDSAKSRTRLLSDLLGSSVFLEQGSNSSTDKSLQPANSDDTDTSGSSDEALLCPMNAKDDQDRQWCNFKISRSSSLRNWATLYVQMQLCERTLRQWLDVRNVSLPSYPIASNSTEGVLALNLFRKIVRGVDYIHSQGIVHHDIKPSNIFVNGNLKEVQVGDFGLSCCLLSRVDSTGVVGEHHGEVGTRMYAAPEQLRGKCTAKSDIYSLGVVLLELLQPFHTDMERSKVIQKLRTGYIPPELSTTWPHAARLMSDLIVTSSKLRPSAGELLQRVDSILRANLESDVNSQLASKDETIRLLKEAVASKDQEIAELKRRLSVFEKD